MRKKVQAMKMYLALIFWTQYECAAVSVCLLRLLCTLQCLGQPPLVTHVVTRLVSYRRCGHDMRLIFTEMSYLLLSLNFIMICVLFTVLWKSLYFLISTELSRYYLHIYLPGVNHCLFMFTCATARYTSLLVISVNFHSCWISSERLDSEWLF